MTTINRTVVPEHRRMSFLPDLVGPAQMIRFENTVYALMQRFSNGVYQGGYWEFYGLSNGGGYMAPILDHDRIRIEIATNGYRGEMSTDAAGIVVTLFALNYVMGHSVDDRGMLPDEYAFLVDHFYALRDYAAEHPEASEIFAAID